MLSASVPLLTLGASVPLLIGGWKHPSEVNVASYSLWLMLATMLAYSMWAQHYPTWRMMFGYVIGNASMVTLGLTHGGYTFNLGTPELIVLFGLVTTVGTWVTVGQITGTRNPRILLIGGILVDIVSYYPQFKQYTLPHEAPTTWMLCGWYMSLAGTTINMFVIERIVQKIRYREKPWPTILEESAFSLENCTFVSILIRLMNT